MTDDKRSPSIRAQLKEYILVGLDPDEAATRLLEPYGGLEDPLCYFVYPLILKAARDCEGEVSRESRNHAFYGEDTKNTREQRLHLPKMVYRMPDGKRVTYDDLTIDMIEAKIAYLRTQIGGLVDHLGILEAAKQVLKNHSATRLSEVPNWVEEVRGIVPQRPENVVEAIVSGAMVLREAPALTAETKVSTRRTPRRFPGR